MTGNHHLRSLAAVPPHVSNPSVRFILGRRDRKTMPQKAPGGRVKVYTDRERCWADARAEFGKKIVLFDVFGMDAEAWERFQRDVPFIEIANEHPVPVSEGVVG